MSLLSLIPRDIHRYNILPSLPSNIIDIYTTITPEISEHTKDYQFDNSYWKKRIEFKFNKGMPLSVYNVRWEVVYNNVRWEVVYNNVRWEVVCNNLVNNLLGSGDGIRDNLLFLKDREYIELALDMGADPSANNNEAIRQASEQGHSEVVKILIADERVDPSAKDNEAIRLASYKGHTEVVKLLMEDKRVNPTDNNNQAITWASKNGHVKVVKLLLKDKRVDPSSNNNEAIRWASYNCHTEVVKLLIEDKRVASREIARDFM